MAAVGGGGGGGRPPVNSCFEYSWNHPGQFLIIFLNKNRVKCRQKVEKRQVFNFETAVRRRVGGD